MVLVTTLVGFHVGSVGLSDQFRLLHALVGTGLAAAGSLALNQYVERDVDGRMERTRRRPLPDKRLQPRDALWFGLALTLAGPMYLGITVNWLSAAVVAITAASYLLAYTPLKRRSSLCTVLGAIPGALPPVAGWVAARGDFGVGAGVLFGILFWRLPHTLAIAWVYRRDHARRSPDAPVVDPEAQHRPAGVINCLALLAVGLLPGRRHDGSVISGRSAAWGAMRVWSRPGRHAFSGNAPFDTHRLSIFLPVRPMAVDKIPF
jgi:protoheme IX farnesyltransferase